jgi:hypothetical protein
MVDAHERIEQCRVGTVQAMGLEMISTTSRLHAGDGALCGSGADEDFGRHVFFSKLVCDGSIVD